MSTNNTWDLFLVKAKEVGKAVGDVASDVVESSRQKLDELKAKKDLSAAYEQLGRLCYKSLNGEEQDSEKLKLQADEIEKIEARLAEIRATAGKKKEEDCPIACPHCNGLNPKEATFCSYCGKALREE